MPLVMVTFSYVIFEVIIWPTIDLLIIVPINNFSRLVAHATYTACAQHAVLVCGFKLYLCHCTRHRHNYEVEIELTIKLTMGVASGYTHLLNSSDFAVTI